MSENIETAKNKLQTLVSSASDRNSWSGVADVVETKVGIELKAAYPSDADPLQFERYRQTGIIEAHALIEALDKQGLVGVLKEGGDLKSVLENLSNDTPIQVRANVTVSMNKNGGVELVLKSNDKIEIINQKLDAAVKDLNYASVGVAGTNKAKGEHENPFVGFSAIHS